MHIWLLDLPPATDIKTQVNMIENEGFCYLMYLVQKSGLWSSLEKTNYRSPNGNL
jgi:hypothetical protein